MTVENCYWEDIKQHLTSTVRYALGSAVEGDIVEFGTGIGRTAGYLSEALSFYGEFFKEAMQKHGVDNKNLYLFDSFEGLPIATSEEDLTSPHVKAGVWEKGTCLGLNERQLVDHCNQWLDKSKIHTVNGFFDESLASIKDNQKFCLVHIDCDLYSSITSVLEYLHKKSCLSDGCVLLFDDWLCNRGNPNFGAQKAWNDFTAKNRLNYTDLGIYNMKGKSIIVHT
ncbi:TylF/MycF/NovP-related O-methyltransferase [Thalassotalea marina]|uniref:Methyltransferase n=1 Tax=Thalassotalea marina TaxID=1673741 RepID=A0A919BC42_9GAMM|nr:TylF/MycF/NovP-related O-methyltransferase [Thalassotalea marina]GHF80555.1 hypothetical protein GCM10017161_04820 [Thalassotalea marina]